MSPQFLCLVSPITRTATRVAVVAGALVALAAVAAATPLPPAKPVLVAVTHVRDGDTFTGTFPDGAPDVFRVAGVDASEVSRPEACAYARTLAADATALLGKLLGAAPDRVRVVVLFLEPGKRGRLVAEVLVDGRSVERALYDSGIVRLWAGRRRPWCREDSL